MIGITEMIWKTTNGLGQEVTWYSIEEIKKIMYEQCPCRNNFNVFGLDDRGCCYKYGKYCKDVIECKIKRGVK